MAYGSRIKTEVLVRDVMNNPVMTISIDGKADAIAKKVEYMELTVEGDFQKEFMEAMQFPHMKDSFPHLKGIVRDEILNQ